VIANSETRGTLFEARSQAFLSTLAACPIVCDADLRKAAHKAGVKGLEIH
jgi:hypothetical protein